VGSRHNSIMQRVLSLIVRLWLLACASPADAHEGWGLIVHPDGTIYFSDIPTNTIWRVTPAGRLEVAAHDKHSHALVGMDDGTIYSTNVYAGPSGPHRLLSRSPFITNHTQVARSQIRCKTAAIWLS